ncbi:MAG: LysR family transcriptional regulator [Eubacteriales bacterium]|nr:LysR family transcriptional regulator [Eubacteriales bacterium]
MKIDRIRCFENVGKTLNFSQSAKELYMSQPSISRIISSLEQEVGAKLLIRGAKQMTLTAEGEVFLKHCKKMTALWEAAVRDVQNIQMKSQELKVGILGFAEERLIRAIASLEKDYPEVRLQMISLDMSKPYELLDTGALDCFMYWENRMEKDVEYLPLFCGRRRAYLNKNHPLCRKETVTMEELSEIPQIIFDFNGKEDDTQYREGFPEAYRERLQLIKVNDVMTSRRLLELNKGVILSPSGGILVESSQVKELEIEGAEDIRLGLCYRKENRNVILKKLLEYLK